MDLGESGFDLGTFLNQQAQAGAQESTGEFSVSNEKALEKLAQYSLVGQYTWLLKLLQSVCLWNPPELEVQQSMEQTTFFFCPETQLPTETEVAEIFLSGLSQKDQALPQLCLALRALVEQAGLAFVLSINSDQPSTSPIYSGEDVAKLPESQRLRWASHSRRGIQLVISHYKGNESWTGRLFPTFTRWERRDKKIASLLEDNAIFHPVPIKFEGRLLNEIMSHNAYGFSRKQRPIVISGVKLGEEFAKLRTPQCFEEKRLSVTTHPSRAARSYQGGRTFDAWFILRSRPPNLMRQNLSYFAKPVHEILWLKNGVVVERSTAKGLTSMVQVTILLSAEHFGTDLSGLALVKSPKRKAIEAQALGNISVKCLEFASESGFLVREDEDEFSPQDTPPKEGEALTNELVPSVAFGFFGAVTLGATTPFLPTMIATSGLAGFVGYASRKYRESESVQVGLRGRWVEAVGADLSRLSELHDVKFEFSQTSAGAGLEREELFQPRRDGGANAAPYKAPAESSLGKPENPEALFRPKGP